MVRAHPRSLVLALAAPVLLSSGCGKQVCFHWSTLEGACPPREDATAFFATEGCLSPVRSIDSEGEFDGELCCYEATTVDTGDEECSVAPSPGGGGQPLPK